MLVYNERQNICESYIGNEMFWIWDRPFFFLVKSEIYLGKQMWKEKKDVKNTIESRMHAEKENINPIKSIRLYFFKIS